VPILDTVTAGTQLVACLFSRMLESRIDRLRHHLVRTVVSCDRFGCSGVCWPGEWNVWSALSPKLWIS